FDERIVHERMVNDVDRHGSTLYNFFFMRAQGRFHGSHKSHVARRKSTLPRTTLSVLSTLLIISTILSAQAARRRVSLVITGGIVVTQNATRQVLNPGAVAIDGADIVAVDTPQAILAGYDAAETIDARGQVVLPGLINTHTHAPMVLYRGLADDLALMDWLQKYIFPAEAKTVSP